MRPHRCICWHGSSQGSTMRLLVVSPVRRYFTLQTGLERAIKTAPSQNHTGLLNYLQFHKNQLCSLNITSLPNWKSWIIIPTLLLTALFFYIFWWISPKVRDIPTFFCWISPACHEAIEGLVSLPHLFATYQEAMTRVGHGWVNIRSGAPQWWNVGS